MALKAMTSASLLSSFQSSLTAALKAEGLIPMSAGITKPVRVAENFHDVAFEAMAQMDAAQSQFGPRAFDRYGDGMDSYSASRFAVIASLESISTKSYPDAGGRSVGLGFHMDKEGARDVWERAFGNTVSFDDVYAGKSTITTAQAKHLFDNDILYYEKVVDRALGGTPVTQNQRLALVSIAYNAPARVAKLAPVLQSGDSAKITAALLTQTFNPNHSQVEALKQRRYIETSLFNGSASAASLMPKFEDYYNAVAVQDGKVTVAGRAVTDTDTQMNFVPNGAGALRVDIPTDNLAPLAYTNQSANRNLKVDPNLEAQIRASVTSVYGADHRVEIMSGGDVTGTGTRRHGTMTAADVYIYDPTGKRLTAEQMKPLAQDWIARDIGSVGLPVKGSTQSMHLDLIGGSVPGSTPLIKTKSGKQEGRFWFYGGEDADMRKTLTAKVAPTKYALSPDAVARGLVPPGSLPAVGTELSVQVVGKAAGKAAAMVVPATKPLSVAAKQAAAANAADGGRLAQLVSHDVLGPAKVDETAIRAVKPPVQGLRLPVTPPKTNGFGAKPLSAVEEFGDSTAARLFDESFNKPEVEVPAVIQQAAVPGVSPLAAKGAVAAATKGSGMMGIPAPAVPSAKPMASSSSSYSGGGSTTVSSGPRPMTVVDQYRAAGYSPSQAYDAANQSAADRAHNSGKYGNDGKASFDPVSNSWKS